jgi:hypothetical protein
MAQVNLWRREAHEGNVPPVCVRCGTPASTWKNYAAFVGLGGLPLFIIISIIFLDNMDNYGSRIWLRLPFCNRHRHYWLWRRVINFGSFAAVIFLPILGLVFLNEYPDGTMYADPSLDGSSPKPDTLARQLAGLVCMLSLVAPVLWLVAYFMWCRTGVRVAGYDKESVALGGVCQEFADAVPEYRRSTAKDLPGLGRFALPPATNWDERIQDL